eukprot:435946-Pyramimonas_sp.AAC.1
MTHPIGRRNPYECLSPSAAEGTPYAAPSGGTVAVPSATGAIASAAAAAAAMMATATTTPNATMGTPTLGNG